MNVLEKAYTATSPIPSHLVDTLVCEPLCFMLAIYESLNFKETATKLLDIKSETRFNAFFALGPFGIHAVAQMLNRLYGLMSNFSTLQTTAVCQSPMAAISKCALAMVRHFRHLNARALWDKNGSIRAFQVAHHEALLDGALLAGCFLVNS